MLLKSLLPILAASLVALQSSSLALSFGVGPKIGASFAGADVEDNIDDEERRTGIGLGLGAEFGVTSPFSLMVEPMYLQRGARFDILGSRARGDLDYFEIPVLAKAKFGSISTAHAYLFLGPSFGLKVSSEGRYLTFKDEFEEDLASFTFSGDVGAGVAYRLQRYVYLSADARYSHGFTDALENPIAGGAIDSWYSRDIRLMAAILFHLTE